MLCCYLGGKEIQTKRRYIYIHNWFTVLHSRNKHNIVKQLYCNNFVKKKNWHKKKWINRTESLKKKIQFFFMYLFNAINLEKRPQLCRKSSLPFWTVRNSQRIRKVWDFPGDATGKNPPASAWVRKIHRRRAQKPTPVFLPGESHGQRSLAGCSPSGHTESDMTVAT